MDERGVGTTGARLRLAVLLSVGLALAVPNLASAAPPPTVRPAPQAVQPSSGPRVLVSRIPTDRPIAAHEVARRLGLAYQDQVDHVLLTDHGTTLVRVWKDSHRVSISGREVQMIGRTVRRGRALYMPGPMAGFVERRVAEQRVVAVRPVAAAPKRRELPPLPAPDLPTPPRPAPRPAREAHPAPRRVAVHPEWEPRVRDNSWRWIVLHHSDDTSGNLAKYDRIHREVNHWDECGYHFIIGNGSLSGDGQVEVGTRWPVQKHGAHCKTDDNCYNDFGVGICLVGDFETRGRPSNSQMDALVELCTWLMVRFDLPPEAVVGHCDCKATACPGRHFPWAELRQRLAYLSGTQRLALR